MGRKDETDPGDLENMVEHILYEVNAFRKSFGRWRALKPTDEDWNAVVESALLHLRVLRDFFLCREPKYDDDIIAADYFPRGGWNPAGPSALQNTKDEIDKRLAHLTTRRLARVTWDRGLMEKAVEDLISLFKRSLRDPQAGWFSKLEIRPLNGYVVGDGAPGTETVVIRG